jgi:hypothetical protein
MRGETSSLDAASRGLVGPWGRGVTPNEFAIRYRISPDRVRAMIARGELRALNLATAKCRKPRYVILPEHLAEFERGRQTAEPPKPARRKRLPTIKDYYPD